MNSDSNFIPSRIVEILCPEMTMSEILIIQKRIYNTIMIEKRSKLDQIDTEEEDGPITACGYWHTTARQNDTDKVSIIGDHCLFS